MSCRQYHVHPTGVCVITLPVWLAYWSGSGRHILAAYGRHIRWCWWGSGIQWKEWSEQEGHCDTAGDGGAVHHEVESAGALSEGNKIKVKWERGRGEMKWKNNKISGQRRATRERRSQPSVPICQTSKLLLLRPLAPLNPTCKTNKGTSAHGYDFDQVLFERPSNSPGPIEWR